MRIAVARSGRGQGTARRRRIFSEATSATTVTPETSAAITSGTRMRSRSVPAEAICLAQAARKRASAAATPAACTLEAATLLKVLAVADVVSAAVTRTAADTPPVTEAAENITAEADLGASGS